ncbi:acyltransferase family protein [Haloechinothrix halophila]|uniref:acyltransferase family protein n=1 Tax=Haloechinothrix halophila TaxID=1069073 RepID=UPI000409710D|nr:acyltransferase family protein [Haloechinothrix halophila]
MAGTELRGAAVRPPSARKINWDLIRVVAVVAVMMGHITFIGPAVMPGVDSYPVTVSMRMGASVLLVISAFFACVTIRREEPGRWLRRRLARLLPAYLTAVVLTYVVTRVAVLAFNGWHVRNGLIGVLFGTPYATSPAAHDPWYLPTPADLLANLTLLQPWSADLRFIDWAYWTLPVQVAAFIGAAILWRRRLRGARLQTLARVLVLLPVVLWPLKWLPQPVTAVLGTIQAGTGIGHAYLFGLGVAIWLWSRREISHVELVVLGSVGVVLHAVKAPFPTEAGIGFAVMLVLIAAAARGPEWDNWVLRALRRPIVWLAGISYSLYLVHQQLGFVLARVLSDAGMPGWLRLVLVTGAALLAGWALTVLVERPAYRRLTSGPPRQERGTPGPERRTRRPEGGTRRREWGTRRLRRGAEREREPELVGGRL